MCVDIRQTDRQTDEKQLNSGDDGSKGVCAIKMLEKSGGGEKILKLGKHGERVFVC